ncbi:MAG: CBS domain-containing protein [Croceitalea sp.]|nr:CBS domain-containing protein [Croceitalea sp.]MBT8237486.1 CBS domain-containing protein [Croceitalea sp.]NNC33769.1 CBS domain-containing protein [Croceitalea sp.]NNL07760.1 CBS domain-containing protein [Croceitalea sp.]NNM18034.1 CBS domain-containing protein [Croceitalea sp.]
MGEQLQKVTLGGLKEKQDFIKNLLNDLNALELLIERGLIENDIVRIGAEQEVCLINKNYDPWKKSLQLLEAINEGHFTTELAKYNIEINLDPFELKDDCFDLVKKQLLDLLGHGSTIADRMGAKFCLTGILPTISKREVTLDNMTPMPRYFQLNELLKNKKGDDFILKIKGVDEIKLKHNSVLFEACNTSFQLHLQIPSHDFVSSYNWAQAIAAPVLGIACNSPFLMGRELWHETRIALFQQSLDTRKLSYTLKDQAPRVGFGNQWETNSIVDIYKRDISQHSVLLTKPITQDALAMAKKGQAPKLQALSLFNGTVYRWNRPCYGVGNGKAHLRIENRYLPAGPSVVDEMANFVFWVGVMVGRPKQYDDMPSQMDFKDVKSNFIKAARSGKNTILLWNNKPMKVQDLVIKELIPIAEVGLKKHGIDKSDIDFYLNIIKSRAKGHSGSSWQINNYRALKNYLKPEIALRKLTRAICDNQEKGLPVHKWPNIKINGNEKQLPKKIGHMMTTRLMVLKENDFVNMAKAIMDWNHIHHVPVENSKGKLVGLLTYSQLEKHKGIQSFDDTIVSDIMIRDLITVTPQTYTATAKKLMAQHQIGCLPVTKNGTLIGIVSKNDF